MTGGTGAGTDRSTRRSREQILYGLAIGLILTTTITPLIQFGNGRVQVALRDVGVAVVSLLSWALIFAGISYLVRWHDELPRGFVWLFHLTAGVIGIGTHTAIVIATDGWLSGRPVLPAPGSAGPGWVVLTTLGTFQYLTLLSMVLAVSEIRKAERTREQTAILELERAQLEALLDRARVDALRTRLQPHFLFNTLNSILVLTTEHPVGAQQMIRQLSELLRAAIADDGATTIPLRRELELVSAYLAIQRVRFGERLRVSQDVDASILDMQVPPFLLQPIVENAVLHAVASRESGGSILVTAARHADRLTISVRDDGPGYHPDESGERGLGVRGSHARLAHAFGSDATLALSRGPEGGCEVRIDLPSVRSHA